MHGHSKGRKRQRDIWRWRIWCCEKVSQISIDTHICILALGDLGKGVEREKRFLFFWKGDNYMFCMIVNNLCV